MALSAIPLVRAADTADSVVLEEVTVTAQKREQNIQDVGISITALTGNQLTELGYNSTADIMAQTPSMKMLAFSPSLTVFNIRGVSQNDFADHYEPPVAVFVDEAYISSQGAVNDILFDLERAEVLRGPQGTLFGRNATGGAIQFVSRKPTDQPEGYFEASGGSFGQANFQGAVNGPLADRLDARLAFATVHNEGWLRNADGPDENANNDFAFRLQFAYKPSDAASLLLSLHGSHNNDLSGGYSHESLYENAQGLGTEVPANVNYYGTCPGCDLFGYKANGDPWHQAYDRVGFLRRSIDGATFKATWSLGWATLTSITDYLAMSKRFGSDSDASPNPVLTYDTDQHLNQASQEVR
ncbi:MAG TPA: TonB-dependent receptor plug domain-containing protein, partial [Steroidobacteraceae bacterium]|nr:TonB-dependent receptor plug domain-containing protein [Steroidobacteraceae bacterium]